MTPTASAKRKPLVSAAVSRLLEEFAAPIKLSAKSEVTNWSPRTAMTVPSRAIPALISSVTVPEAAAGLAPGLPGPGHARRGGPAGARRTGRRTRRGSRDPQEAGSEGRSRIAATILTDIVGREAALGLLVATCPPRSVQPLLEQHVALLEREVVLRARQNVDRHEARAPTSRVKKKPLSLLCVMMCECALDELRISVC